MSNAVVHCMPQRRRRPASILARPWPRLAGSAVRLGRSSDPHLATLSHHRAVARPRIRLTEVYVHLRARSVPRAARDLPGAAPPELLGGAAEGAGAALVAAGGGRTPSSGPRWRRSSSLEGPHERRRSARQPDTHAPVCTAEKGAMDVGSGTRGADCGRLARCTPEPCRSGVPSGRGEARHGRGVAAVSLTVTKDGERPRSMAPPPDTWIPTVRALDASGRTL